MFDLEVELFKQGFEQKKVKIEINVEGLGDISPS